MVEILIQGDNADTVARDTRAAFQEIFEVDPLVSTRGGADAPGTRSGLEPFILALAVPPAVIYSQHIVRQLDLSARWGRLISKGDTLCKDKGTVLLLDTGKGKPIPLHQANREQILEALKVLEAQMKS